MTIGKYRVLYECMSSDSPMSNRKLSNYSRCGCKICPKNMILELMYKLKVLKLEARLMNDCLEMRNLYPYQQCFLLYFSTLKVILDFSSGQTT